MADGELEVAEWCKDAKIMRYPHRYSDPRGKVMWKWVTELLQQRERLTA
jgi:hypothetical protein